MAERRGVFIVFDGVSGCGKGTMVKKTFEYIYDKSKKFDNILVTDEPTLGPYGSKIREYFKRQKSSGDFSEELFGLFVKDREWHIEKIIKPALKKSFVVICDRYKYSSIAYQTAQGNDFEKVFAAHKDFLAPDLALILDADPSEAYRRMNSEKSEKRKESDKFRGLEFISGLRKFFLDAPKFLPEENIRVIDANKPIDEVFSQIRSFLDEVLP